MKSLRLNDMAFRRPDVISLEPVGGTINVDNAITVSGTFIGRFTDSVRIEGNGITLEGNPEMVSSGGIEYTKNNAIKPVSQDVVAVAAFSFSKVAENVSVEIENLVVDGLNGFLLLEQNAVASVRNTIFRNSVPYWPDPTVGNYRPHGFIEALEGSTVNLSKVVLEKVNPYFSVFGTGAEYAWAGAIAATQSVLNISDSIIRGSSSTAGAVNLVGGTANIVSSIFTGSAGGLSVRDDGAVPGVMNVVNSLLRFDASSTAIGRIQAFAGGESNLVATTVQASGLFLSSTGGNCSVPSSDPNYLCNGSPLQAFAGGVIRLKESAVAAINMESVPVDAPYSEAYVLNGVPTTGDLLADGYSYVQPTANLPGSALRTLFDQPGLRTDGVPYALDVNGLLYFPLPQGAVPQGPLLAVIPDADGANQLINPIDGSVITKDVYGNPRTTNGTRAIGAVQTPGPLPIAGFGVAFGWSRRLRNRVRKAR